MNNMDPMMTNEVPMDGLQQGNIATNLMANMGTENADHLLGEIEGFGNIGYANVL